MPEEVANAKAENELPTISKDKPEIIQEVASQINKEKSKPRSQAESLASSGAKAKKK